MEPVATRLYLVFGVIVAATLLYIALSENLKRGSQQVQVEGASEQQLKRAQELRDLLARDSTNVEARTQLGNVLYDTGNWKDAIPQYVFVLGRDSTRVPVLVDIGVCYFNLSQPDVAESYFKKALVLDPHQSVAHFNMGIVRESRRDFAGAMSAYHLALEASPSDELRQAVLAAMQRIQQQTGKAAPPLDQTAPQPPSK
jgi:tetratricopeptide (TPR) repeat protein